MKGFTIVTFLCAVLCFDFSTQDKLQIRVGAETIQKLRQAAEVCGQETGVPAAVLKQIIEWPLDNDEATKKFFYCVCINADFTDKDGHAIVNNMAVMKAINGTQEDYINSLKECNKVTLENHLETIYAVASCIHGKNMFIVDA